MWGIDGIDVVLELVNAMLVVGALNLNLINAIECIFVVIVLFVNEIKVLVEVLFDICIHGAPFGNKSINGILMFV